MTGGWAATNTLREALDYMEAITLALGPGERTTKLADARAALAAVEATLIVADDIEGAVDGILNDGRVTIGCEHTLALAAAVRRIEGDQ